MKEIFINLSSITFALKSEKILNQFNIYNRIVRTPSSYSKCGCGYSLVIYRKNLDDVINILNKHKISVISIIDE